MAKGRIEFAPTPDPEPDDDGFNDTSFDVDAFESSSDPLPPDPEEDFPELDVQEVAIDVPLVTNKLDDIVKETKNDKSLAKEVEDEIKKLVKTAEKEAKQTLKEETRRDKRELQDEARELRRQKHSDMREATERRKEIRAQATQDKIATYSLASALGMQGYVVASIVDKFVYEPRENDALQQESTYQKDYQSYFETQEDSIIERRREIEDRASQKIELKLENEQEIRDSLMQSKKGGTVTNPPAPSIINNQNVNISPVTNTPPVNNQTGYQSQTGTTPTVIPGLDNGSIPPTVPPNGNPPGTPTITPSTPPPTNPPNNQTNSSGGGTVPPTLPPNGGNPQPPTPPTPQSPSFDISNLVPIVYAIRYAADIVKETTAGIGNTSRQQIDAIGSEKGIEGVSKYAQSIGTMAGSTPIIGGVLEAAISPFTESVKTFESAVTTFESFANKDLGFAPEALGESVNIKVEKLIQSMSIAQETDSSKAEIIRATGKLDMVWAAFRRDVIVAWTPILISLLEIVTAIATTLRVLHKVTVTLLATQQSMLSWTVWFYGKASSWLNKSVAGGPINQNVLDKVAAFHNAGGRITKKPDNIPKKKKI